VGYHPIIYMLALLVVAKKHLSMQKITTLDGWDVLMLRRLDNG